MLMRVLLDTNILLSYLLTPSHESPVTTIVQRGLLKEFALLLPEDLLVELQKKAREKPYLARRIEPQEVDRLVGILARTSESIPRIDQAIPAVTRDPKDDYLLAYAMIGRADYLVTDDNDLLVLHKVGSVVILPAASFLQLLQQASCK